MKTQWRYPRAQFQAIRVLTGGSLALFFGQLAFGRIPLSSEWHHVFPSLEWQSFATSFPNLLSYIPLWSLGLGLGILSLLLMAGVQRKFVSSLILYGHGCLHEGLILEVTPTSLGILFLLLVFMLVPEREHMREKWSFPIGVFVAGQGMALFYYLMLLNPFAIPEQLLQGQTGIYPMPIAIVFTLGILTLVLKDKRYVFWGFSLALSIVAGMTFLTLGSFLIIVCVLGIIIDPAWWLEHDESEEIERVLYYDGECGLCERAVQFTLEYDIAQKVSFLPLQNRLTEKRLPPEFQSVRQSLESVIYQRGNVFSIKSKAILLLLHDLGGLWRILSILRFIPENITNRGYDLIARHRLRFFGKADLCELPAPEYRARFLEAQVEGHED
jgi:predicted DCC family thiol-disulfide oxidoreductase YuxK